MEVDPLFCSRSCEDNRNRSFKACPQCAKIWDSTDNETERYYCNTAWVMCSTCSINNSSCATCGKSLKANASGKVLYFFKKVIGRAK